MKRIAVILALFSTSNATFAQDESGPVFADELRAVRMAVADLAATFPSAYTRGQEFLDRADEIALMAKSKDRSRALDELRREALLSNPLMDFSHILLVRRKKDDRAQGLPRNWQGNESIQRVGYANSIELLSLDDREEALKTVYKPAGGRFVGDLNLSFDGERLLFSMPGKNERWQIHELKALPTGIGNGGEVVVREVALIPDDDVDNYDACYLPNGNIVFTSTATYTGVPCVRGRSHVANTYLLDTGTGKIRRLTFDQDHNWNPTVLNNGRIMYLRWEYSDLPHFAGRILFHMNPDGTNQTEYYGSGSYWPNSFFYARAVPDHPTRVIGVVSGHHGAKRAGELVLLDPALGRQEADGAVQRIPGYGKPVEPVILDRLVDESWPKFLHPYPLSSKHFFVSMQRSKEDSWAIYLVDAFDNMLLLKQEEGFDLLEPIPLVKRPLPPVIPDRVDPELKDATVYLQDIYAGPGLKGTPRGTVKELRLITYHFSYRNMGGQQDPIGVDGPWDIKCVLGTVPVETDGSALFRVPANVPISFQPLDEEGKAIQLMRSWTTAMPGEHVSCVGCHERQNTAPLSKATTAARKAPADITPWRDKVRGFSFKREVEPVIEKHCSACHGADAATSANLPAAPEIEDPYMFLARMVRSPTMEGDMHMCEPYEFHADTTELVRLLRSGHHDVELDADSWDRIITWIDLNKPFHGTWTENVGRERMSDSAERRRDLMRRYSGIDGVVEDPDALIEEKPPEEQTAQLNVNEVSEERRSDNVTLVNIASNSRMPETSVVDLGGDARLELIRIPAGSWQRGADLIEIDEPFWIASHETSNRLYAIFDPQHDSRLEPADWLHFDSVRRGYPLNEPDQPVVKISWLDAMDYCRWLSERTGRDVTLPTEEQWEWACRAGSTNPFWYGDAGFAAYENLADARFKKSVWQDAEKYGRRWEWRPAAVDQDDGYRVSSPVGSFKPNPWGLFDMHGNVAEWTNSVYDSEEAPVADKRVVRGGSWSDRPRWAAASDRWGYREYQKVYNVGFRVIVKASD